jgi:hypothetical protein
MNGSLEIKTKVEGNKVIAELKGAIDEDAEFSKIKELEGMESYQFNFEDISSINSCGVREWTNFVSSLGEKAEIKYFNCRQIIIEQINMVHGFIPENARIESFYAPYFCEDLDKEYKILLKASDVIDKSAPKVDCPDGEHKMEFDAIEAQYFSFIK